MDVKVTKHDNSQVFGNKKGQELRKLIHKPIKLELCI